MKTVIYLDVLLLVNFLIAWFLLLAAGAVSGQRAGAARMAAASALAALSSLILLAPELPYPVQLLYKAGPAALVVLATFGWHGPRRFVTAVCWFTAFHLALAGLAILTVLQSDTDLVQTGNLAVYLRISPVLLLVLSGICCLGVELLTRAGSRPSKTETAGMELELCGTTIHLRAALDTGCHLKDPITCLPVLLVSYPDAKGRLPAEVSAFLEDWFAGTRQVRPPGQSSLRLIPCNTAAQHSLLPGFAVGEIRLITPKGVLGLGRSAVAFAPQSFESDAYEALYGPDFL